MNLMFGWNAELFHRIAATSAGTSNKTISATALTFKKNSPSQGFPRRQHQSPPFVTSTSVRNTRAISRITCLKMDKSVGGLTNKDAGVDIDMNRTA